MIKGLRSFHFWKKIKIDNPFFIQEGRFKYGKIDDFSYKLQWTEDSFSPDVGKKDIVGKAFNYSQIPFLGFFLFIFIFILLSRSAYLQIVKGDYYYKMAEGNRIRFERIEAKRGVIYDNHLRPLVRNTANFLLYFIPADLPQGEELDSIFLDISTILGTSTIEEAKSSLKQIRKGSLESYKPLFVADNIEYEKAMFLYLKSAHWPGVVLSNKSRRQYELPAKSLSHILGYTGKINQKELEEFGDEYLPIDYIGKMGIEYFWENELKGKNGKKQIEVDALGKEKKILSEEKGEDGHNLVLSIDVEAQKKLEEIITSYLKKLKLKRAAGIVMDPNNGEIIAMVSIPFYDNNIFARGISYKEYQELINNPDHPLFNRAISGEYPSGSTIKPVLAAAALQERIISEYTSFLSTGGLRIGQWFFPDWRAGGHGLVDVRKAIAQSVNTFFYYIGGGYKDFKGLGIDRIIYYYKLFGLGSQTGIDLAGEASGFVPTPEWKEKVKGEPWYIGDTYHISIGQGDLLVTPLQVANFTSVFANKGKLYRPHLVKQILSSDDKLLIEVNDPPVRANFIDLYNIKVVREGMRQTVLNGSARSLQSVPVSVAGKTGTAQWSSKHKPHAWFTGFAPFDKPQIVITVLVEEGGEGSYVSVPIAKEFLEWYFKKE